jgi:hypothetical protein
MSQKTEYKTLQVKKEDWIKLKKMCLNNNFKKLHEIITTLIELYEIGIKDVFGEEDQK